MSSPRSSPDGKQVVTASWDDTTRRVWSAADGKSIAGAQEGHAGPVYSAAFSPDGKQVVTASDDKTARVWNAADGKPITELKGHASRGATPPRSAGQPWSRHRLGRTARVWVPPMGLRVLKGHADWCNSAVFSPDGKQVVTASDDKTARVWSTSDGKPIAELEGARRIK